MSGSAAAVRSTSGRHPDVSVHDLADRLTQRFDTEPFRDKAGCPEIHRAADRPRIVACRYNDHRNGRKLRTQVDQAREAADSWHRQIQQDQVDIGFSIEQSSKLLERSGFIDLCGCDHGRDRLSQSIAKERMVVGDNKMRTGGDGH
jgi:hypothetical protein